MTSAVSLPTRTSAAPVPAPAQGRLSAVKAQQVPADPPAPKVDPAQQLQVDSQIRAQRLTQALDRNLLDYSFDKQSNTLSVKVVNKQSGEFIRQIDFNGFEPMKFSAHGYKGRYVDNAA